MTIETFLIEAKKRNLELQVAVFEENALDLNILNGTQRKYIISAETSYEIKAHLNNKFVKINTNYLSEELFTRLIESSKNIESSYDDCLIDNKTQTKVKKASKIKAFDSSQLLQLSQIPKNHPFLTNIELNYSQSHTAKRIVNTHDVDISSSKKLTAFYVNVTGKYQNKLYTVDDVIYQTKEDIDFADVISKTISKLELTIHQQKINSNKYNVILSPTFTAHLLKEFTQLLSKEEIRKKTSCLANKLHQQLFSKNLTIIEEPRNKNYPGYATKTTKKSIIKDGILKTYLYNNKEALLDHRKSTGNSFYSSITTTNFYIKEKTASVENLLTELNSGLYINNYLETGGVTLNPTTGAISLQVFGYIVENGKLTQSFEPCILTTTIFELFSNIKNVGNKIEFKTATTAAPYLLVENMSISSN